MQANRKQGVIGWFLGSTFPPIFIVFALVAGFVALLLTPREEDPQIVVPMADILVSAPGLSAQQMATQVTEPLERLVSQIDGVEYVYSQSNRDQAMVTVRFFVGEGREDSLVKLYNKLYSHQDEIPSFVSSWVIKPVEIDDVPIVVAALYSTDADKTDSFALRRIAEQATQKLKAIPHTNRVDVVGGQSRRVEIGIDSIALAAHNTSIDDIERALSASNSQQSVGAIQQEDSRIIVQSGEFVRSAQELAALVVNVVNGRPVYLQDVATVSDGAATPQDYTFYYPGGTSNGQQYPAVFLAVAKQKGANAVSVAEAVLAELETLEAEWLPNNVEFDVIRNYGETADAKVKELVSSLVVAIIVVVVFVGLFLNWRAAAVVAIAIPISYGATLGMDLLFGYSINRVTMFALILALGLIVDDPIAAIDNIERHMSAAGAKTKQSIIAGMVEIRSALLMSTIAIIIVFTPMFFITGMMGPYMAPMAFNVPIAVIFSTITAFLVTPWLAWKIMRVAENKGVYDPSNSLLYRGYRKVLEPVIKNAKRRKLFLWGVFGLFILAAILPALRLVPLKLLPHDNKNEFQVIVNMPEGTALERTNATLSVFAEYLQRVPEIESISSFAGVPSPMDFNGMVRHYFRRAQGYQGELRIVLVDKFERAMQSNELVTRLRDDLESIARAQGAQIELVQMPPGPPVLATLVAEVYGSDRTSYNELEHAANTVAERLGREDLVSQVDTSVPADQRVWRFIVDQEKAARSGIAASDVHRTLSAAIDGRVVDYLQLPEEVNPLPIEVRLPIDQRDSLDYLLSLNVRGQQGYVLNPQSSGVEPAPAPLVSIAELGEFVEVEHDRPIFHKNLRPVVYVYGEVTGRVPANAVVDMMADQNTERDNYRSAWQRTYLTNGSGFGWQVPEDIDVVWSGEGEWKITIDVFRDLGIAYGVALLGVYVVMVLQTGLKAVSGIMMLSIPLTIIGIMPGFWFLNMFAADIGRYPNPTLFTATAMIGMIALAGIVVRNALILIEFIQQRLQTGCDLKEALFDAGAARTRPILLTAGTTMLANIVITLDPIFNGLAWAVIFGITASTLFTLVVIPVVYYSMYHDTPGHGLPQPIAQEEN
ncbi:MAG: RND-type NFE family putative nodulcation factor export system permease component [Idiomarinaceae bacterium HL-53]|nr:MAG: RND-type NFE family putative nodulcation factor export system permease component [Idiomarinaceae bacterium HL-53]CUS48684.1 Multidrug efflux pump subunit AcrB [Idiomarinaceae bacterium HL-53]